MLKDIFFVFLGGVTGLLILSAIDPSEMGAVIQTIQTHVKESTK